MSVVEDRNGPLSALQIPDRKIYAGHPVFLILYIFWMDEVPFLFLRVLHSIFAEILYLSLSDVHR